jgi:hypothetical protein
MMPTFSHTRAECPVLSCTRTMPSSDEICAHCWQHVPADIRRAIAKEPVHSRRRGELMTLAVSAAQVAT